MYRGKASTNQSLYQKLISIEKAADVKQPPHTQSCTGKGLGRTKILTDAAAKAFGKVD